MAAGSQCPPSPAEEQHQQPVNPTTATRHTLGSTRPHLTFTAAAASVIIIPTLQARRPELWEMKAKLTHSSSRTKTETQTHLTPEPMLCLHFITGGRTQLDLKTVARQGQAVVRKWPRSHWAWPHCLLFSEPQGPPEGGMPVRGWGSARLSGCGLLAGGTAPAAFLERLSVVSRAPALPGSSPLLPHALSSPLTCCPAFDQPGSKSPPQAQGEADL